METHQAVVRVGRRPLDVYISTQFIWGVRDAVAREARPAARQGAGRLRVHGRRLRLEERPWRLHVHRAPSSRSAPGRPVRCALTRREENLATGNRNATIQRLRRRRARDGTLVALDGEFVNAVGWGGWYGADVRADGDALRLRERAHADLQREAEHPADAAFRAPGFVEGTFGLECLLDELAAKLGLDPLELRKPQLRGLHRRRRPYSSKNLIECYRRAEPHWERRHEVRARSEGPWKRGVGLASQTWYGGGGPPSYAWVRLGSDARATVITAMQDIGTGTRDHDGADRGRGARASARPRRRRLSATPRAARTPRSRPARRRRPRWDRRCAPPPRTPPGRSSRSPRSATTGSSACCRSRAATSSPPTAARGRSRRSSACWRTRRSSARAPAARTRRACSVLTLGVQVAEVAVDVETGEVRVERVAAIHDVGRVINPLVASSQVEGGVIQAVGHTLSEDRLLDPATRDGAHADPGRVQLPTIADVPEIVTELLDVPDEHLTNLGSKGLGEPPIVPTAAAIANAIRDATGAEVRSLPITREEMLRALREARERERACSYSGLKPSRRGSRCARERHRRARRRHRARPAATRDGSSSAETLVDLSRRRPARRATGRASARAPRSAELEADPRDPGGAAGGLPPRLLAAAPRDGDDRRQPPPGDALLVLAAEVPVLPARRRCLPRTRGRAPRARDLRATSAARRPPVRPGGRAARARRDTSLTDGASSRSRSCTGCPPTTTATWSRSTRTS